MTFKIGALNKKQTLAAAAVVIGVILIAFADHGMHKVQEVKGSINHFTDFFTNSKGIWNPVIEFFGGEVQAKASEYDSTLMILMIVGIAMVVSGTWGIFHYKERRKK
jgi:hypothetical protein